MVYGSATTPADVKLHEELTWPGVAAATRADAPVLVPLGATEQHCPHLPFGTDTFQGIEVAGRAVVTLAAEGIPAVLGPAIPYGPSQFLSEAPRDFPGTIALGHGTLTLLIGEVCRGLIRPGFMRLDLLLANAETDPVMQIAAKEVVDSTGADVVTLDWLVGAAPEDRGMRRSSWPQGHAGEGETARMLAIMPHLARMDQAKPCHPHIPPRAAHGHVMPYLGGGVGRFCFSEKVFAGFDDGIRGEPANATAEDGHAHHGIFAGWVTRVIAADKRNTAG